MSPEIEAKQNEELADALTTVSVLAKRLAKTIRENEEDNDVQKLRTDGKDRQG